MANLSNTDNNICCNLSKYNFTTGHDPPLRPEIPSQNRTPYSSLAVSLTVIPVSVLIVIVVSGNLLVIVAVLCDRRLNSQLQNWLILSLAMADLLVGLLIMPITLTYELLDYWILGEAMCEIWLACDVLFVTASILNLCAISLDRYWSLTNPIYYATRRTQKRTLLMIGCVWALAFLVCCPLIVNWRGRTVEAEYQCLLSEDLAYVVYSSCGSFFIPVIILLFVYARIYRITRRRAKKNLRRNRRKQEMLQCVDEEPELTTAYTATNPADGFGDIHDESPTQKELGNITTISGIVGGGLLTIAWNIAAISRCSMGNCPALPHPVSPYRGRSLTDNRELPNRKRTLRRNGSVSSSFPISASRTKALAPNCYPAHANNETIQQETVFGRSRGSTVDRTDLALSIRPFDLQRQMLRNRKQLRRKERQATSLLGLIVLSFVGCWAPFFCLYLLRAICCEPPDLLFDIIFWLGYCNSAFNPFIYNFFNQEFRQAFVKILTPNKRQ